MRGHATPEEMLIGLVLVLIGLGSIQLLYYRVVRRHIESQIFPDSSSFVSVMVPVRDSSPTLAANLMSLVDQHYPNYEVIFVTERMDDPGVKAVERIVRDWTSGAEGDGAPAGSDHGGGSVPPGLATAWSPPSFGPASSTSSAAATVTAPSSGPASSTSSATAGSTSSATAGSTSSATASGSCVPLDTESPAGRPHAGSRSRPVRVSHVCAGELRDLRMTAKSHNLISGVEHARGDILLFTDSDVHHPPDWIREMVNPIGSRYGGREIHATTAIFFLDPRGFLGNFASLSTNAATYLASFTRRGQDFPPYASGASMAVLTDVFHRAGVVDVWRTSLNDDLVLANTLVDRGYTIFSVRRLPTHPVERFDSWHGMNRKMIRWMLTLVHYSHPNNNRDAFMNALCNLQFQTMLAVVVVLGILDLLSVAEIHWTVPLLLLAVTYLFNVLSRSIIALRIGERNVYPYLWLSPVSQLFWGWYLIFVMFFVRSFSWGGRTYRVRKRWGRLVKKNGSGTG